MYSLNYYVYIDIVALSSENMKVHLPGGTNLWFLSVDK